MKFDKSVFQTFSLISQLGVSIVAPILLCTLLGVYLDGKFSLSSTVWLIILGVLAGVRNAYVLLKNANKKSEVEDDEET